MKKIYGLFLCSLLLSVGACSSTDPDYGEQHSSETNVPDPTGTVTISMRNDDGTSLDGLYISADNNFHGYNFMIADIGSVNGLGNVSYIPMTGWASKVAVVPGHGYVAAEATWQYGGTYNVKYYRLYVTEYIIAAGSNGIIGADVKYQKPFKGLDLTINTNQTKVSMGNEGGETEIVFTNNAVIPFTVESSESWCNVKRASTLSEPFLYDAIVVTCEPSYSKNDRSATVTIKTGYDKETTIDVTQVAMGEFMVVSSDEVTFGFDPNYVQTRSVQIYTNVAIDDIDVRPSQPWIEAVIVESRASEAGRKVKWVEGEADSRAEGDEVYNYYLTVKVEAYAGKNDREGTVKIYHGDSSEEIRVAQKGSNITFDNTFFEFAAEGGTQQVNPSNSSIKLVVDEDGADWCTVSYNGRYHMITCAANPYQEKRSTKIKAYYASNVEPNDLIEELTVEQAGMVYSDQYVYFDNKASNYTIAYPLPDNPNITSSESWCTAALSGSNIIIRVTATSVNRSAVINVEGINVKIYVSQSKYSVGDTYSENGVEGKIVKMQDGTGFILKTFIDESLVWSTENVDNYGARSMDDGMANCAAIMTIPDWEELYPALKWVEGLNTDGVEGWYIPAINELYGMNEYIIPFWTSTEKDSNNQYYYSYSYGSKSGAGPKSSTARILAMYRFSYDFNK